MIPLKVSEIAKAVGGTLLCGNPDIEITSVACDSREVKDGTLFVPIRGEKVDAHKFIEDCLKNCSATFTEYDAPENAEKPYIKVENTLTALQALGAYYRSRFDIKIIGVTGSVGKTSTKEMIAAALSQGSNVFKTKGNRNSQIGLPLTMLDIMPENETAVIEMGMSEFGEMERLCAIAKPSMAVMTNIGTAHIENLGSRENIMSEKFKITGNFTKDSTLFLNGDDELLVTLYGKQDFKTDPFDIFNEEPDETEEIEIPTLGEHNVKNALAAFAVAKACGLSTDVIKAGLLTYKNAPMRQQIHKLDGCTLIDDSYNASPDAMKVSLDVLKSIEATKRIAVLANMLELGDYAESEHFSVGEHLGEIGIDCVICIGSLAENIAKGALSKNKNVTAKCFADNASAISYLKTQIVDGCAILVKGSRSMHTEEISKAVIADKSK